MIQRHGLQLLHDADVAAIADIIFVHGLFGHPTNTWTTTSPELVPTEAYLSTGSTSGEDAGSETSLDQRKRSRWRVWNKRERGISPQSSIQAPVIAKEGSESEIDSAVGHVDRKHDSVFWPMDLLPKRFPESRIYSWGYDVDINHIFRPAGQSTVFQHAQTLLSDLAGVRISHELMLNASRNEVTHLKEILPATHGIIFLGTPHRGSETATLGKMAQEITRILWKRPNIAVLRDLEVNSEVLDRVGRGFSQILVNHQISICSFKEELPTKGIMVVNSFSSALENGLEIVSSIPANHENMTKFSSENDIGFQRIAGSLERWKVDISRRRLALESQSTTEIEGRDSQGQPISPRPHEPSSHSIISAGEGSGQVLSKDDKELLQTLCVSDYDEAKKGIAPRVDGTCSWFLKHLKYLDWQRSDKSSLLWVSGEPGCGKTVLSAFLSEELKTMSSRPTQVLYFFCDQKSGSQVTGADIMCGLLHQLLSTNYFLIKHARARFDSMGSQIVNRLQRLWNIFEEATSDPRCEHLICIIDALDECERTSAQDLIKLITAYFAKISTLNVTSSPLKMFLTSRPYLWIERAFTGVSNVRLKAEDETESIGTDISLVIEERLKTVKELTDCTEETKAKIKKQLLQNAGRTFLWVSLVLKLLESSVESSEAALLQTVSSLPEELYDVYEQILQNNPDQERARYALSVIVAARRPFSLAELNIALAIREGDKSENDIAARLAPKENIEKWIKRICGPFIRVANSKVSLVHLTAVEFLWKDRHDGNLAINLSNVSRAPSSESLRNSFVPVSRHSQGLDENYHSVWRNSIDPEVAHFLLGRICVWYLSFNIFETAPLVISPDSKHKDLGDNYAGALVRDYLEIHTFLEYAAKYWGWHFWKSENKWQGAQSKPIFELYSTQNLRFQTWFQVLWSSMSQKRAPQNVPMLSVASYFGHRGIIKKLVDDGIDVNTRDSDGYAALHWAVWHAEGLLWEGHEAVQPLLDAGADIEAQDFDGMTPLMWAVHNRQYALVKLLLSRGVAVNSRNSRGYTALHFAAESDVTKIALALIEYSSIDINAENEQKSTPLHSAAIKGHVDIAGILLKHGAHIAAQNNTGATPLCLAVSNGHEALVQLLLDSGADARIQETSKWTILHRASTGGHEHILRLLLSRDIGLDIDATDTEKWTPLHLASAEGHIKAAQILIENGASIEARTERGVTPLHLAALNGYTALAQLLLERGADAKALSLSNWNVLHSASSCGSDEIVLLLLRVVKELEINATADSNLTALHMAASSGHINVVRILLEHGAIIEARADKSATPLHFAASNGHGALAKLLLAQGADATALGPFNWTPLHYASAKGLDEVVLLLLQPPFSNEINTEATDTTDWTALHLAAANGHIGVARALINHDCSMKARTNQEMTPLLLAAMNGHIETVKLLLDKGTDLKALTTTSAYNALHIASVAGRHSVVQLLLELKLEGLEVESKCALGCTALVYAACAGHEEAVRVLLEHGANTMATDGAGETPLQLASAGKHFKVMELLSPAPPTKPERRPTLPALKFLLPLSFLIAFLSFGLIFLFGNSSSE